MESPIHDFNALYQQLAQIHLPAPEPEDSDD